MKKLSVILGTVMLLADMASLAVAQTPPSPKAVYAADSQKALSRYQTDKKLCNDETSSTARLQCRRDAKADYDKALSEAKAQLAASTPAKAPASHRAQPACAECARVIAVGMTEKAGESSPVGLIAGGAAGAVLGHQVGGGMGKDLATIAGAVGGAYAGKKIEEKVKTHKVWTVHVQYADGRRSTFDFSQPPGLRVGDQVRNAGNSIVRF